MEGFSLSTVPVGPEETTTMQVTLQFFEGCHGWKVTQRRLREVLGPDAVIDYRRVESHADAVALGFRGSPTVLVDGEDPFTEAAAPVGMACRIYRTDDGQEDAPSVEQLREALGVAR